MTCRECRHWEQCVLPDGTTKYYGTEIACGDVHRQCKWFIPKTERQKWIPVTERLPEEHRRVLCYQVYGGNLLSIIQDNEWLGEEWEIDSGRVTHWMPLPEPPKEGE